MKLQDFEDIKRIPDDKEMLRAAVELTRDISAARGDIYWPDMLLSAAVGYAGIAGAILLQSPWAAVLSGAIAVLALYRALLFIHELSHIHRNGAAGVPLRVESCGGRSDAHALVHV